MRDIKIYTNDWPLKKPFRIARGVKTKAETLTIAISENGATGRGECVPYGRYGETIETVSATIEELIPMLTAGLDRTALQTALLPGAARNAIDCALWDLECKTNNQSIYARLGLDAPRALLTAYTLSLDTPGQMAKAARAAAAYQLIKVKLGGPQGLVGDLDCLDAVRAVLPNHRLIIDANEAWTCEALHQHATALYGLAPEIIEQPVPAGADAGLSEINLPFCADESLHDRADLAALDKGYQWINIKLDKAGGLTEALEVVQAARKADLKIMIGCMVASSLAMAPACVVAQYADLVDLDGSLLLTEDVEPALDINDAMIAPISPSLWG